MYKVHLKLELEHWLKYFHGDYVDLLTLIVGIKYKAILPGWDPTFFSILDICWRLFCWPLNSLVYDPVLPDCGWGHRCTWRNEKGAIHKLRWQAMGRGLVKCQCHYKVQILEFAFFWIVFKGVDGGDNPVNVVCEWSNPKCNLDLGVINNWYCV